MQYNTTITSDQYQDTVQYTTFETHIVRIEGSRRSDSKKAKAHKY